MKKDRSVDMGFLESKEKYEAKIYFSGLLNHLVIIDDEDDLPK